MFVGALDGPEMLPEGVMVVRLPPLMTETKGAAETGADRDPVVTDDDGTREASAEAKRELTCR
jgi:hypothetical protein